MASTQPTTDEVAREMHRFVHEKLNQPMEAVNFDELHPFTQNWWRLNAEYCLTQSAKMREENDEALLNTRWIADELNQVDDSVPAIKKSINKLQADNNSLRTQNELLQSQASIALNLIEKLQGLVNRSCAEDAQHEEGLHSEECIALEQFLKIAPTTPNLVEQVRELEESLQECRDRIAAHDGCSRYQIGDSCIIERANKLLHATNPQPES